MRRLVCVLFSVLLAVATADAQLGTIKFSGAPAAAQVAVTFQGSPNNTITPGTIAGSIAASRTSCQTPCHIQVSASPITATGTTKPYEDLEYQWDFGDPGGAETFTNPVTTSGINMNTGQYGGEASYIYRSACSPCTVTLNVRGKNGGGFATGSFTLSVTVTAFDKSGGEFWFDQVNGNDGNNGTSSATPKQSLSALNALIASKTSFHLAQKSNWAGTTGILIPDAATAGIRFDSYVGSGGAGANPIVNVNSGSNNAFHSDTNGAHDHTDIVLSNVTLEQSGSATTATIVEVFTGQNAHIVQDIYFDHVDMLCPINVTTGDRISVIFQWTGGTTASGTMFNIGLWGGSIVTSQTSVPSGTKGGFFEGPQNWLSIVGLTISGAHQDTNFDHHFYPSVQSHVLFRYVTCGSGPSTGYCINGNYEALNAPPDYSQFWTISENYMSGTSFGIDAGDIFNDANVRFKNFIIQQNAFTGLTGSGAIYFISNAETMTVRDNKAWNLSASFFGPNTTANSLFFTPQIYRNKGYSTIATPSLAFISIDSDASKTTFPKWIITDNIWYSTGTAARIIDPIVSSAAAGSWLVDRNQYYAPNDSDAKFLYDGTTAITFGAWQADTLDTNGSVANPNWADPANGNFNFLMKRDLDPVNDNTPMWLNKVA